MTEQIMGVECPDCGKRLFSYSHHDYKTCGCPNETMVDGGRSYLRYGGKKLPQEVLLDPEKDKEAYECLKKQSPGRLPPWPY